VEPRYLGDPKDPYAILIPNSTSTEGISFFSPENFGLQLGLINRKSGYEVKAHAHNQVLRQISITQEFLFVKSGKIIVNIFDEMSTLIHSLTLSEGDSVLLAKGGHEVIFLEDSSLLEIKQGPYLGKEDKYFIEVGHDPSK
jgi:hypothetical protein